MRPDAVQLFLNPTAGRGRAGKRKARICELLRASGMQVELTESRDVGDLESQVLAAVSGILSEHGISIEAMQQKEPAPGETQVPLVMLTQPVRESQMNSALGAIEALDSVAGEVARIRLEQLS